MAGTQVKVLLAVRDAEHSAALSQALLHAGAAVSVIGRRGGDVVGQILERARSQSPSMLVLELETDTGLLERVRTVCPTLPVVVLMTKPTPGAAFAVSRLGADDLWTLPIDRGSLPSRVQQLLQRAQQAHSALSGKQEPPNRSRSGVPKPADAEGAKHRSAEPSLMLGANPMMAEIHETIEKVAGTDITVLIRGESGVGKEVVARMLFDRSRRRQKPFVKVNCAAIPHDLLESELFGYEAGAFTGANRDKPGKFEMANHGTLFLDEIAEMHPMLQAKLLHILQDGRFSRLGAKRDISVDVRILCATNKLLEQRVSEGLFREDLLYRINAVTVFLPPLRERRDEIPQLIEYLLQKFSLQYERAFQPFSAEVLRQMMEYDWPGNIRELENLCKRYVIVGGETQILRELSERNQARVKARLVDLNPKGSVLVDSDSGEPTTGGETPISLLEVGRRAAWEAERRAILEMLESTRWNRREAARRLQVSYKALLNKIKHLQLHENDATPRGSEGNNEVVG
ncbi:MAG: sigma 54-interacting transcriptional regulator [Acidobacteriaceae bacterium]